MSDQRTQQSNGAQEKEAVVLPDDVLSRIVAETERHFTARASRPSPIHLRTWYEIERFAERAAYSGMVPRDYVGKPDAICIAIQMGAELGLSPMMSLKGIAVVNGRPSVYGDVAIGLCRMSGKAAYITEGFTQGESSDLTYWCEAKRKDDPHPIRRTFSVADAEKANLWGKAGPWTQYPKRMLAMRARGFCLRDAFPDVLEGLITAEEAADIPFEDTGLTVTMPPVATQQPIGPAISRTESSPPAGQPAQPQRTLRMVQDAIEAAAKAALTPQDIDRLEQSEDVVKIRTDDRVSATRVAEVNGIIAFHRKRVEAFIQEPPEDDTSFEGVDTVENDPALSVVPPNDEAPPIPGAADDLIEQIMQMDQVELDGLGASATFRAKCNAFDKFDYDRVQTAIAHRVAQLNVARQGKPKAG